MNRRKFLQSATVAGVAATAALVGKQATSMANSSTPNSNIATGGQIENWLLNSGQNRVDGNLLTFVKSDIA